MSVSELSFVSGACMIQHGGCIRSGSSAKPPCVVGQPAVGDMTWVVMRRQKDVHITKMCSRNRLLPG